MKRNKKNTSSTNNLLDEVIRRGVQIDLEKEDAEPILTDEDMKQLNIPLPPADMYEQIMKKNKTDKRPKKIRVKIIVLVAALIAALLASALSVQAVRVYIHKISAEIMGLDSNSIEANTGGSDIFNAEDNETYRRIENELGHEGHSRNDKQI